MVTNLIMSAKLAILGLLTTKIFWNKDHEVIISGHDVTNKRDLWNNRFYWLLDRHFDINLIVTLIPIKVSGLVAKNIFCFLLIASWTLLQSRAKFNRFLWRNFLTCYSCSIIAPWLQKGFLLTRNIETSKLSNQSCSKVHFSKLNKF